MSISIWACGDTVLNISNTKIISDELSEIITSSNISICNFEAPVKSKGTPIPKVGPHVHQLKSAIGTIKNCGFDMLSLANNHIYDYGETGLKDTIDEITKNNLDYIGAGLTFDEAYSLMLKEIENTKIGFLAFCEAEFGALIEDEGRGGYAWINHPSVNNIIRDSKQKVDILILIVHAGVEEVPLPLPEWRARYRELCDLGADVVIGHHPHVPQGWEKYNESLIFYSLGNFYFDWDAFRDKEDISYSVLLKIENKKIDYKVITHKKVDECVEIVEDKSFKEYLDKLNIILKNNYLEIANQQSIYLYKTRYECYYKAYAMLLLHNVRIESHRFATQRALSLLTEKNYDENYNQFEKILTEWTYK